MKKSEEKSYSDTAAHGLPGSANDDALIRGIISDTIRHSNFTREAVAEEMTALLATKVSASMLYQFSAESAAPHRWPLAWTRAFCQITNDWRLLSAISARAGFLFVDAREARLLELGRKVAERHVNDREIAALLEQEASR